MILKKREFLQSVKNRNFEKKSVIFSQCVKKHEFKITYF